MAFMFGSVLGWGDRRLIEEGDWLQIRLPASILSKNTDPLWEEVLRQEQWLRENWWPSLNTTSPLTRESIQQQEKLEQVVFQLYDLSKQEILLIEDTIQYGISPILTKQLRTLNAFNPATIDDCLR